MTDDDEELTRRVESLMRRTPLMDEAQLFLDTFYPGSTLNDSSNFVQLNGWKWLARTVFTGVSAAQMYADLFRNEDRLLITCVDMDMSLFVPDSTTVDTRSVVHVRDWNAEELATQSFAAVHGSDLDAPGFFARAKSTRNADYVFSPSTGFALTHEGCFAPTAERRAELERRYPPLTP